MARVLRRLLKWGAIAFCAIVALGVIALAVAYFRSDNDCGKRPTPVPQNAMKAAVYCEYGPPSVIRIETIEKPTPADDQVLVKIHDASVNPLDWHYVRGEPLFMRLEAGVRKPAATRLGVDFAGTVEATGKNVTQFKTGDAVFGGRNGSFSEYVAVSATRIVKKPENISFEQAAATPVAAITALQALRDQGKVKTGQRVLINGASGGVGTFAVQIAKSMGAHVTGVCSTRNIELVRSLGADEVIDYTKQSYITAGQRYDVIVDMVGNHPLRAHKAVLTPKGTYVLVGGPKGRWLAPMDRFAGAMALSCFGDQKFAGFIAKLNAEDLGVLRDLMESGKVTPVIDRRFSLDDTAKAVEYLEGGRARGKVVINVAR